MSGMRYSVVMTADEFIIKDVKRDVANARAVGDQVGEARALFALASILAGSDRLIESQSVLNQLKPLAAGLVSSAEQRVIDVRNGGNGRAEAHALFELSKLLRYAGRDEEAARTAEQASLCLNEQIESDRLARLETAKRAAAQAIAEARERGDARAEANAFFELGRELLSAGHEESAKRAEEAAKRIIREQRALERVKSATDVVSSARAGKDVVGEVLALLALGRSFSILKRPVEAELAFERAERLSYDAVVAAKTTTNDQGRYGLLAEVTKLTALGKALADAGRSDAARHVGNHANQLDLAGTDTGPRTSQSDRSPRSRWPLVRTLRRSTETPAPEIQRSANHASDIEANTIIQVGIMHGDLKIHDGHRGNTTSLNVAIDTEKFVRHSEDGTKYNVDTKIHVLVEAFTPQAVILRQLRPVITRRVKLRLSNSYKMYFDMKPRKFSVGLDPTSWRTGLDGPSSGLLPAFATGTEDFPFFVTDSNPEYFVIEPEPQSVDELIEWHLELDWTCLGKNGTLVIDRGSGPFISVPKIENAK